MAALLLAPHAEARELFLQVTAVDDSIQYSSGANNILQIPDFLTSPEILKHYPTYQGTEAVVSALDLRGLVMGIGFEANSNALFIRVPSLQIDFTLNELELLTRDQAIELLQRWIDRKFIPSDSSGAGGGAAADDFSISPLLQALIRFSPVDPVAGNPTSLFSRMFASDYIMSTRGPFIGDVSDEQYGGREGLMDFSFQVIPYSGGPYTGVSYELRYQHDWNWPAEHAAFVFDLPLTVIDTQSATSVHASAALGMRIRLTDWWNLSPTIRAGGAGSVDLGGLAILYSGTLTSHLRWHLGDYEVGMGNMIGGGANVEGVSFGGVPIDYDLGNFVLKNGVFVGRALGTRAFGRPVRLRLHYDITNFFGRALYSEIEHDVGITIGLAGNSWSQSYAGPQLEIAYLGGEDFNSARLRIGFRF